jgi:putative addiction module component (TIGR02574 family)
MPRSEVPATTTFRCTLPSHGRRGLLDHHGPVVQGAVAPVFRDRALIWSKLGPGVASFRAGLYASGMARAEDHLAELLRLPLEQRAKAARALLDSLDEDGEDQDAEKAQVEELIRRMRALDAGEVKLIDNADARARVLARLRSVRGQ